MLRQKMTPRSLAGSIVIALPEVQLLIVYNMNSRNEQPKRAQETSMETTAERTCLIAEVLAFVGAAQRMPGVCRIALIGSLTTQKADPKDANLLLTVTEDTELASLARLSWRLRGQAHLMP
jgi:hypothetical protein